MRHYTVKSLIDGLRNEFSEERCMENPYYSIFNPVGMIRDKRNYEVQRRCGVPEANRAQIDRLEVLARAIWGLEMKSR